jgi:hypothetical protein
MVERLAPALVDLADVSALADLGIIEPRAFRPVFDAWRANPSSEEQGFRYVWTMLAVEAWLRGLHRLPRRFEGLGPRRP